MPVGKDRDYYSLTKISEFQADAKVLVDAKVLPILSMAGWYNKPVQCAHKSQAQGGLASLDIYMYGQQHLHQGEVRDHQRGLREVSCCGFCRA